MSDDWVTLTGVQVPPIFDTPDVIPTGMDPTSVDAVKEYIEKLRVKGEKMKLKGLQAWVIEQKFEGRVHFNKWWTKIWKKCKGNEKVDKFLKDNGWGAVDVYRDIDFARTPLPSDVPAAGDGLATFIFGEQQSTHERHGGIHPQYRWIGEFMQTRSYERVGRVVKRLEDKLPAQVKNLENDIKGV